MKHVSIIIPNWNGRKLLADYFPSVVASAVKYREQTNAEIEIIVVDDASSDESREWLHDNYGGSNDIRVVELEHNVGFLRAVNKGFEVANSDIVLLLNNDVLTVPDCIQPLVNHFENRDVFAVCCRAGRVNSNRLDGGGKIGEFRRGFWRVFLNYEAVTAEADCELISFFGSGGYTAYDREKWKALGGFQDALSPNYWEDVEICYRAWKRGWKTIYEPNSHVRHLGSATMKRKLGSEMSTVTERNRLLMTWINLHDRRMFASHLTWLAIKLVGSVISLDWIFVRSFFRAVVKLSKALKLRRIEADAAVITDRDLARIFYRVRHEPGVYVVPDKAAEIAFRAQYENK